MKNWKVLAIVGVVLLAALICVSPVPRRGEVRRQPYLEPNLIPTAEYLMENPQPEPPFIRVGNPLPGSTINSVERISFSINRGRFWGSSLSEDEAPSTSRIGGNTDVFVNGYLFPEINAYTLAMLTYDDEGRWIAEPLYFEVRPELEIGLHLVEVRTSDSILGIAGIGQVSYRWAFRLEEPPE